MQEIRLTDMYRRSIKLAFGGIMILIASQFALSQPACSGKAMFTEPVCIGNTLSTDENALLETDLRAHMNPTRQQTILAATKNLLKAMEEDCPSCQWPGFRVEERIPGLPCSACGTATRLTLHEIFVCDQCKHRVKKNRSDGKVIADPYDCDQCNP